MYLYINIYNLPCFNIKYTNQISIKLFMYYIGKKKLNKKKLYSYNNRGYFSYPYMGITFTCSYPKISNFLTVHKYICFFILIDNSYTAIQGKFIYIYEKKTRGK